MRLCIQPNNQPRQVSACASPHYFVCSTLIETYLDFLGQFVAQYTSRSYLRRVLPIRASLRIIIPSLSRCCEREHSLIKSKGSRPSLLAGIEGQRLDLYQYLEHHTAFSPSVQQARTRGSLYILRFYSVCMSSRGLVFYANVWRRRMYIRASYATISSHAWTDWSYLQIPLLYFC